MSFAPETRRRRTFAIISHPDAGKTTLTEKLLLFSGAIQIAGAVKGRKASRHATSLQDILPPRVDAIAPIAAPVRRRIQAARNAAG